MADLNRYLAQTTGIPGFFTREAMIAWDFFLGTQTRMRVGGHFLEVGVLEGKSAVLGAGYLQPGERAVLIDINPCEEALRRVRATRPEGVTFVQLPSHAAWRDEGVRHLSGAYRFIHIDGDHAGYSVATDLRAAAEAMAEMGVICMDDFFNPIYPQVTAAVYRFLFDHPLSVRMVLCGGNKCFLVRASAYRMYEELIRKYFVDHAAAFGGRFSLHKTTYAHDQGCFSMWTEHDRRAFGIAYEPADLRATGLDSNQADIVF